MSISSNELGARGPLESRTGVWLQVEVWDDSVGGDQFGRYAVCRHTQQNSLRHGPEWAEATCP